MAEVEISDSETESCSILQVPELYVEGRERHSLARVARSLRKRSFRQRHVYTADLARFLKLKTLDEIEAMSMAGHSDQAIIDELNRKYLLVKSKSDKINNNHRFKKKSFDSYVEDFKTYMATGAGKTFYDAADQDESMMENKSIEAEIKHSGTRDGIQSDHSEPDVETEIETDIEIPDVGEQLDSEGGRRSNSMHSKNSVKNDEANTVCDVEGSINRSEMKNYTNETRIANIHNGTANFSDSENGEEDVSLNDTCVSNPKLPPSDEPNVAINPLAADVEMQDISEAGPRDGPGESAARDYAEASPEDENVGGDVSTLGYSRLRKRNFEQTHIYTIDLIRHLGLMEESELRYLAHANKSEAEIHKILNALFIRKRAKLKQRGQLNGYFRNESFYDCLKQDRALLKKRLDDGPNIDSQAFENEASDDLYSSSIEGSQDSVVQYSDAERPISKTKSRSSSPEVSVGDRVYRSYSHALKGVLPASFSSLNHRTSKPHQKIFKSPRKESHSTQDDHDLFASEAESEAESLKDEGPDDIDLFGMAEEDYRSGIQRMLNVVRSKKTGRDKDLQPKFKRRTKERTKVQRQKQFAKQVNPFQRMSGEPSFLDQSTHASTHLSSRQSFHQPLRSAKHSSIHHPHKYAEENFDYWRKPTVMNPQIEIIDLEQTSTSSDYDMEPAPAIETSNGIYSFQLLESPRFVESTVFKAALSPLITHFEGDSVSFSLKDGMIVLARFSDNTLKAEKVITEMLRLWKKNKFDEVIILLKRLLEWVLINTDNADVLKTLSFLAKKIVQVALSTESDLPSLGYLALFLNCLNLLPHKHHKEEVIVKYFQVMLKMSPHELYLMFQSDDEHLCSFTIVTQLCKDWNLFNRAAATAGAKNVLGYVEFISSYKRPMSENWALVESVASLNLEEAEVDSLLETIHNQTTNCNWTLREKVITKVYNIFSRRKFSAFPKERENLCLQLSVPSEHFKEADSLLTKYLRILSLYVSRTTDNKRRLLEKITPLSDIQSSSKQTIVNRINILLVMSLLFEKDFQSQLTPSVERLLDLGLFNHVFSVLRTLFNVAKPFDLLSSVLKYCVQLKASQQHIDKLLEELEFRFASSDFFPKLLPCLLPLFESPYVSVTRLLRLVSNANSDCGEVELEKLLTALRKTVTSTSRRVASISERKTACLAIEVWVAVACLLKHSWYQVIYMDWSYAKAPGTDFDDQLNMVFLSEVLKYRDKELYHSESLLFWNSLVSNVVKIHDGSVFSAYLERLIKLVQELDSNNLLFSDSSPSTQEQYGLRIAIRLCGSSSMNPNSNKLLLAMVMSVKAELTFLEQHQRYRLSTYRRFVTPIIRYMNYTSSKNFLKTCVEFVEIRNKLEIPQMAVTDGFGMLLEDKPGPLKVCEYLQEELITHAIQGTTSQFHHDASKYILVKYSNPSFHICLETSVLFPACLLISVYASLSGSNMLLSHWFQLLLRLVEQKACAGLGEDDLWCLLRLLRAISNCPLPHAVYGNSLQLVASVRQCFSTFSDYSNLQVLIQRLVSSSDVTSSSLTFHSLCHELSPTSIMLMENHPDALRDGSSGTMYTLREAFGNLETDSEGESRGASRDISFDFFP